MEEIKTVEYESEGNFPEEIDEQIDILKSKIDSPGDRGIIENYIDVFEDYLIKWFEDHQSQETVIDELNNCKRCCYYQPDSISKCRLEGNPPESCKYYCMKEETPPPGHLKLNKVPFEKYERSTQIKTVCIANHDIIIDSDICQSCKHFHGAWITKGYILCSLETVIIEKPRNRGSSTFADGITEAIKKIVETENQNYIKIRELKPVDVADIILFENQCIDRLKATGMTIDEATNHIIETKNFSKRTRSHYPDMLEASVRMEEDGI